MLGVRHRATNALRRSSFRLSFKLAMKHCAAQHRSLWGTMSWAHRNLEAKKEGWEGADCGALVVHDQTKQRSQGVELAPRPVTPNQMTTAA
jgi:hypothetical protein